MVKVVNFMILSQLEKGFRVNKIPSVPPKGSNNDRTCHRDTRINWKSSNLHQSK